MASGNSLVSFSPLQNEPPATNYATLDTRNGHPVLDFDATTQEGAVFTGVLPRHYSGLGITVAVHWAATSATSGTVAWQVAFERIGAGSVDLDADGFAGNHTVTDTTVPANAGEVVIATGALANGTEIDNLVAGEAFRMRLLRDVGTDTATGDAELVAIHLYET